MRVPAHRSQIAAPAAPAQAGAPAAAPSRQNLIEADVRLVANAQGQLAPTGQVQLNVEFMHRLMRHLTRKKKSFGDLVGGFNPATKTFDVEKLQVKVKGRTLNLSGSLRLDAANNSVGFHIEKPRLHVLGAAIPVPASWVAKIVAKEINPDVTAQAKGDMITLDTTSLLHEIEVLPGWLGMKPDGVGVEVAPSGDVTVKFAPGAPAPNLPDTPDSDLRLEADAAAVKRALTPVLGRDFELKGVELGEGAIKLKGKVEVKPASDLINLGKGLLALLLLADGKRPNNVETERVMIDLDLDVQLRGNQAVLTPSIRQAVGELEKTLEKAGLNPVRDGNSLRFDISAMTAKYGIQNIQIKPAGVTADARLDIPAMIQAPILKGKA